MKMKMKIIKKVVLLFLTLALVGCIKEVENKKKKLEKRISEIDKEQGELFEKLVELNVNDTSKEKVIEKIIKAYMIESEKIIFDEEKDIDKLDEDE